MYRIGVVALFPELVAPVTSVGVVGRARERGLLALEHVSPRDFTTDRHRTVDDRPYGGGPGMVLKYEPLRDAVRALRARLPAGTREIVLTAQGRPFDQAFARELASAPGLLLIAGRYEGLDERFVEGEVAHGAVARRLRAFGRRARGGRRDRHGRAALARGARARGLERRGVVHGRAARLPAVHAARGRRRPRRAGGAARRRSRGGAALAAEAGARADLARGGLSCSRLGC